jgi:hypothetical protein
LLTGCVTASAASPIERSDRSGSQLVLTLPDAHVLIDSRSTRWRVAGGVFDRMTIEYRATGADWPERWTLASEAGASPDVKLDIAAKDPHANDPAGGHPPSLVVLAPDVQIPQTVQYSVGVDHQLSKSTTLSVTYTGSHGFHLFRSRDINAPPPPLYQSRPDPTVGVLRQIESTGRQQSDSLSVTIRGRMTKWFTGQAQYAMARTYNDTNGSFSTWESMLCATDEGNWGYCAVARFGDRWYTVGNRVDAAPRSANAAGYIDPGGDFIRIADKPSIGGGIGIEGHKAICDSLGRLYVAGGLTTGSTETAVVHRWTPGTAVAAATVEPVGMYVRPLTVSADRSSGWRSGWSGMRARASQLRQNRMVASMRAAASATSVGEASPSAHDSAQKARSPLDST